jgi:4-phospho-D-threonate 3-dehydrogenase / 4-phospho-D-erythronate 3-dehydrogenase
VSRPLIAVTMGDAAGIGPEIVVKALADRQLRDELDAVVIGDAGRLRAAAELVRSPLEVTVVDDTAAARSTRAIACLDLDLLPDDLVVGEVSATAGEAAYQSVVRAVELALAGQVDAICTAPLNKEALHAAGRRYPGHTELIAELTGTPDYAMMLTAATLRVIHVTTHVGLLDAIESIDPPRVERVVRLGDRALRSMGVAAPRIAVCAINPHAGEGGLFGRGEEAAKIVPAVQAVVADEIDAAGPLPADTAFFRASRGDFDLVVAMYHDQGHGPIKVLGIDGGVNVTVGLPIVRTSVDHGTAFDIAGTGVAGPESMKAALREAVRLTTHAAAR